MGKQIMKDRHFQRKPLRNSVEQQQGPSDVLKKNPLPATDNKLSDADLNSVDKSMSMVRHENFQGEIKVVKRSRVLPSENGLETGETANEHTSADAGSSENRISKKMKLADVELALDEENSGVTGVVMEKAKGDLKDEKKTSHHVHEDVRAKIVKDSNGKDKMVVQSVKHSEQPNISPEEFKSHTIDF